MTHETAFGLFRFLAASGLAGCLAALAAIVKRRRA